jgi:hypothetical protein
MLCIMGEIDDALGKAIIVVFSRTLGSNPVFQKYEWQIVACVLVLPIIWMAIYRKPRPMNSYADFASAYRHMSDDQLLLVANEGGLVEEANRALSEELKRRDLKPSDLYLKPSDLPNYKPSHDEPTKPNKESIIIVMFRILRLAPKVAWHSLKVEAPTGLRIPLVMSVIALIIAIFADMPYDFFVLLRVLIFVTCIACATTLWKSGQAGTIWLWIMVTIAVVYNPLLPIHLKRETWEWINIATIPVFCLLCFLIKQHQDAA